jgi:Lhr-like helicase
MASCEGRKPRIPQYDAGTLTLPPVSVPMIKRRTFWFNLLRTSQETYKLSTKESHLRRNQQALRLLQQQIHWKILQVPDQAHMDF